METTSANTIDLDQLFRRDSKARLVAEALLTGGELERHQLAEDYAVSVTTVNRVVESLARAGARVKRDMIGRRATFEITSIGPPPIDNPYPKLGGKAKIIRADLLGDKVTIDFLVDEARYRGTLTHLLRGAAPVGATATITSLDIEGSGETSVATLTVDGDDTTLTVASCRAVTV